VLVLALTDTVPSPYADLTAGIGPYALVGAVSELLHRSKKVGDAHPHSSHS
jgi:hypothetical protein